jgi:hypothetical protein
MRLMLARQCRARCRQDRQRCGAAPGRGRGRRRGTRPSRSARLDPRSCGCCAGWGRHGRRRSDVRQAAPTLLGIEQRPQVALRRGRSSSPSRRAGDRSMIANLGAGASSASTDAAGEGCRPRDASRPPSRVACPPRMSSPPDHPRIARRLSSGSAPARSDLHDRGVGGAWSPTLNQHRSYHRDERLRVARGRARSTRRWPLRQRVDRCELQLCPNVRELPIPLATSSRTHPADAMHLARPCGRIGLSIG